MLKELTVMGATGSIGRSTLDVVKANPGCFDVRTLVAHSNYKDLARLARDVSANRAVLADETYYGDLKDALAGSGIDIAAGHDAVMAAARENVDLIMCAIAGTAGLEPLIQSLRSGIDVAIANKEPLVAAGDIVMALEAKHGSRILPVDSEHNAIFQVFERENKSRLDKIILTASGGPFLRRDRSSLHDVTPEQAVAHPNWSMGAKVSVDSATLMNKGLEVIEAKYLFDVTPSEIEVVMHPQSIIHSMVSYKDGSILAQLGAPDMKTPIASALAWPERLPKGGDMLDVSTLSKLEFEAPDLDRFPALKLAYDALHAGPHACIALNAANEMAVEAFLNRRIGFLQMTDCLGYALDNLHRISINNLEDVIELDKTIRRKAEDYIAKTAAS